MKFVEALEKIKHPTLPIEDAIRHSCLWLQLYCRFNGHAGHILWRKAEKKIECHYGLVSAEVFEIDYEDFELHLMQASLQE